MFIIITFYIPGFLPNKAIIIDWLKCSPAGPTGRLWHWYGRNSTVIILYIWLVVDCSIEAIFLLIFCDTCSTLNPSHFILAGSYEFWMMIMKKFCGRVVRTLLAIISCSQSCKPSSIALEVPAFRTFLHHTSSKIEKSPAISCIPYNILQNNFLRMWSEIQIVRTSIHPLVPSRYQVWV